MLSKCCIMSLHNTYKFPIINAHDISYSTQTNITLRLNFEPFYEILNKNFLII